MKKTRIQIPIIFSLISSIVFGQASNAAFVNYSDAAFSKSTSNLVAEKVSTEEVVLSPKELVEVGISKMLEDPVLKSAKWGFVVYDPKTKEVITSHNADIPLIPASTTKLLTTEGALNKLGTGFKWTTQLEYSGEINEEGILEGNLYIVGSGDPTLGVNRGGASPYSTIVANFTEAIQQAGIKEVKGDIIIQSAFFKNNKKSILPKNIVWLEHNNYYLPVGMIDDLNKEVEVQADQPLVKSKRYYYHSPETEKMAYSNSFFVRAVTSKLPDAPSYLANSLLGSLNKKGYKVTGKVINKSFDPNPEERRILDAYQSPELQDIVYHINQTSYNPFADNLLKYIGFYEKGDMTLASGSKAVKENLYRRNLEFQGLNYVDGSGLSYSNVVSPISQVKFLSALMKEKYFEEYFRSLPIGGETGTLRGSFKNESFVGGRVFAKTGTLYSKVKVKTLAGFVKTNSGRTLAFSLMVNHYNGSVAQVKDRMERILEPVLNL